MKRYPTSTFSTNFVKSLQKKISQEKIEHRKDLLHPSNNRTIDNHHYIHIRVDDHCLCRRLSYIYSSIVFPIDHIHRATSKSLFAIDNSLGAIFLYPTVLKQMTFSLMHTKHNLFSRTKSREVFSLKICRPIAYKISMK